VVVIEWLVDHATEVQSLYQTANLSNNDLKSQLEGLECYYVNNIQRTCSNDFVLESGITMKIKVGHEFFRKERYSAYADWKTAFWRELEQNSDDAKSRRVDINIVPDGNGCIVGFDDNGCGMSEAVIRDVFMSLGETTKSGDSTGGFGRARMLTHFSMPKYQIKSGCIYVSGKGSEYQIRKSDSYVLGTKQKIWIDDASMSDMEMALHDYLGKCNLAHDIYVNGVRWSKWLYRRKLIRDMTFGSVYVNKSSDLKNTVVFRVNGVMMFTRYTSANALVVIEIYPSISRDVLTSNRDGIHYKYQSELDIFLNKLAIDTTSTLKRRRTNKSTRRQGQGCFISCVKRKELSVMKRDSDPSDSYSGNGGYTMDTSSDEATIKSFTGVVFGGTSQADSEPIAALYGGDGYYGSESECIAKLVESDPTEIDMYDVAILDECQDIGPVSKVIESYDPTNWRDKAGGTKKKLLSLWQIAVKHSLDILQEEKPSDGIPWIVGWVFDDSEEAGMKAAHKMYDDTHGFLINPVGLDGKLQFKLNPEGKSSLFAIALHEVTHVYCEMHNQEFSSLHTALTIKGMSRIKEVLRDMKENS